MINEGKIKYLPNSVFETRQAATLGTFFIQDTNFMMYKGQETFDKCEPTTWLISFDPAAIATNEL